MLPVLEGNNGAAVRCGPGVLLFASGGCVWTPRKSVDDVALFFSVSSHATHGERFGSF